MVNGGIDVSRAVLKERFDYIMYTGGTTSKYWAKLEHNDFFCAEFINPCKYNYYPR